jgi:hypothetical protein
LKKVGTKTKCSFEKIRNASQIFGQKDGVLHQNGHHKHCSFKQRNLIESYIIIALNIIWFGLKKKLKTKFLKIYNEIHKTFLQLELVA